MSRSEWGSSTFGLSAQVNALFVPETFVMGGTCARCSHKAVHGSFIKSVYVTALTSGNSTARVAYHAHTPSRANIVVGAEGVEGAL